MTSICSTVEHTIWLCDWPINWADTGNFIAGAGTLLGAAAVFKAADAFKLWRQQKISERHMEQAERILTATYEAFDALEYCRGVFTMEHELTAARKQSEGAPKWHMIREDKQRRIIQAQAKLNRLRATRGHQDALLKTLPMAKALFGTDLHRAISHFHRQFWILETYLEAYVDDGDGTDPEFTTKIREAMFATNTNGDNEISNVVRASIALIEGTCLPILQLEQPKAPFWKRWSRKGGSVCADQ